MQQFSKNTGNTQRVLGRILAQTLSAGEQQAARELAAGSRPVAPTAQIVKTAPYYFTDSITEDGAASPR